MAVNVLGIGTAVPDVKIEQTDAAELTASFNARTEREGRMLRELYRRSGVKSRHSVILEGTDGGLAARQSFYHEPTTPEDNGPSTAKRMEFYSQRAGALATTAARRALAQSGCNASDITHLVTVSCTGFEAPGFDIALQQTLPLRPTVSRTHLGFMGCHGAMNALRVAEGFAMSQPGARVLVVCAELCSLHHQYGWAPDRIVSNALFADGAGAVVVGAGTTSRVSYLGGGSLIVPGTLGEMTWKIGDNGFAMTLSPQVPDLIKRDLAPFISDWLSRFNVAVSDITSWAIHPGGPRILSAAGEALSLEPSQWAESEAVLSEFGNMSSPTVLFILERLLARGVVGPVVMLAFGPGLTIEAALLQVQPVA